MQPLVPKLNGGESANGGEIAKVRMPVHGLVILDPPMSGTDNMARDEALLVHASPEWPIVIRIYQWETPTLSLGHFQRLEERDSNPRLRELPWVRRKTGGGAIVHDHELTYSILIPNRLNQAPKGHSETLYRAVHQQFVDNLKVMGWAAELSESCTCKLSNDPNSNPFLCFLRRSPVDIVCGEAKILGSAQRRSATGLLQHGSLLLRRSLSTPELIGLVDLHGERMISHPGHEFTSRISDEMRENEVNIAKVEWLNSFVTSNSKVGVEWIQFFASTLIQSLNRLYDVRWSFGDFNDLFRNGRYDLGCSGVSIDTLK